MKWHWPLKFPHSFDSWEFSSGGGFIWFCIKLWRCYDELNKAFHSGGDLLIQFHRQSCCTELWICWRPMGQKGPKYLSVIVFCWAGSINFTDLWAWASACSNSILSECWKQVFNNEASLWRFRLRRETRCSHLTGKGKHEAGFQDSGVGITNLLSINDAAGCSVLVVPLYNFIHWWIFVIEKTYVLGI